MLAPLWAQTCAHFFDVATNPLLSVKANEILTRAGPKTFRKKCKKTRPGVPPEQITPRQDKKNRMFVTCDFSNCQCIPHKKWQQERDPDEAELAVSRVGFVFAKNIFFQKKHDFSNCYLNLDARCQLWSVPDEAELAVSRVGFAFLQTFLKRTPRQDT